MTAVRIKIKVLGENAACGNLSFGVDASARRSLEVGEIIELDDEDPLFIALWDTGKMEMTRDMPTRPLDYASAGEARLCAPSFKSRGPQDDAEIAAAKIAVHARMYPELHVDEVAKGRDFQDSKTRQRRRQIAAQADANEALS